MTLDRELQDLRVLFDWRNVALQADAPARDSTPGRVDEDDLELALELLACNARDREQFHQAREQA